MKKLSIILPVFNGESCIERCLNSILSAKSDDIEVVLINDGSTDKTIQLCEAMSEKDNRLKLYSIKNSGVASARNYGLEHATGEYVAFVDSDDAVSDGYIDMLCDMAGSVDFVMTGYTTIDSTTEKIINEFANCNCCLSTQKFCKDISRWFSPPYLLSPWGKVFKREILLQDDVRFPDKINYGEDVIFVFKYLNSCKSIQCVQNAGYLYTIGDANTLTGKFNEKAIDYDVIGLKELSLLLERNNIDNNEKICQDRLRACFSLYVKRLLNSGKTYKEIRAIFRNKAQTYIEKNVYALKQCSSKGELAVSMALKSNTFLYILYALADKLMR